MGFWSSIGSSVSFGAKAVKETTDTELKKAHGFENFEAYKSELKSFSLETEDEGTEDIANLKNKAANKNG